MKTDIQRLKENVVNRAADANVDELVWVICSAFTEHTSYHPQCTLQPDLVIERVWFVHSDIVVIKLIHVHRLYIAHIVYKFIS